MGFNSFWRCSLKVANTKKSPEKLRHAKGSSTALAQQDDGHAFQVGPSRRFWEGGLSVEEVVERG